MFRLLLIGLCAIASPLTAVEYQISKVQASLHDSLPFLVRELPYRMGDLNITAPQGKKYLVVKSLISTSNWGEKERYLRLKGEELLIRTADGQDIEFNGALNKFNEFAAVSGLSLSMSKPHNNAATDQEFRTFVALVDADFTAGNLIIGEKSTEITVGESVLTANLPITAEIKTIELVESLSSEERRPKGANAIFTPSQGKVVKIQVKWTVTGSISDTYAGEGTNANWQTSDITLKLDNGVALPSIAYQYYAGDRGLGTSYGSTSTSISRSDLDEVEMLFDYYFVVPKDAAKAELTFVRQKSADIEIP